MSDTSDDRLDELGKKIDTTRETAEDAGIIEDPDEPKFYETGDASDVDDQTIAPPG